MRRNITVILVLLAALLAFSACGNNEETPPETEKSGDWRNKIEYEGNFYVDKSTKLLYALDRGTITLWDNAGDGKELQVLEYNSAESNAIETLEIKDVNGDGYNDISAVFSENDEGIKYNLWLWNTANKKYTECKLYRGINNPVISEDKTTVTGTVDRGIFGIVKSTYVFTETLSLVPVSSVVANAEDVAKAISNKLCNEADVTLLEGTATVQSVPCPVYAAQDGSGQKYYIAHTSEDAYWYIDIGCVGAYRMITETDGGYALGGYVDEAGIIADVCAELYSCDVSALTITATSMGSIIKMEYDENGEIIQKVQLEGETPAEDGMEAKGFTFSLDGEELCQMLIAANSSYYCCDPELTGDAYFYMVSASEVAAIVPGTACQYTLI